MKLLGILCVQNDREAMDFFSDQLGFSYIRPFVSLNGNQQFTYMVLFVIISIVVSMQAAFRRSSRVKQLQLVDYSAWKFSKVVIRT